MLERWSDLPEDMRMITRRVQVSWLPSGALSRAYPLLRFCFFFFFFLPSHLYTPTQPSDETTYFSEIGLWWRRVQNCAKSERSLQISVWWGGEGGRRKKDWCNVGPASCSISTVLKPLSKGSDYSFSGPNTPIIHQICSLLIQGAVCEYADEKR